MDASDCSREPSWLLSGKRRQQAGAANRRATRRHGLGRAHSFYTKLDRLYKRLRETPQCLHDCKAILVNYQVRKRNKQPEAVAAV